MTDYLRLLVIFLAAINPAAVVGGIRPVRATWDNETRRKAAVAGAAIALALFAVAAAAGQRLLDFLVVAPETFRIAAGIVMAISGGMAVLGLRTFEGDPEPGWRGGLFPLAMPLMASPAALVAAISYGVDDGASKTLNAMLVPLAVATALVALRVERWQTASSAISRLLGALLVVVAVGLIIEGVRAI
jgi:small neutral amino acid transporter SnatA (MarC family)